jgi:iron(III) transport system ATP-binding protein
MTLLELSAVSRRYGDHVALRDVDLAVPAQSRTAIVGPSGSGKTTLLRIVAGFETPDTGTVRLDGQDLTRVPAHRRDIGYVAQEGALFPHMSIADNIGFGLERSDPSRRTRVTELMDLVGLPATMRDRRPHELSGGQQQRVALARALARKPKLMLLDEPFSALDAGLREAMRDMVGDALKTAGIAAILVTHDRSEALSFADHLAIMRDGRLIQAGTPEALYREPADAATARFLGDALIIEADIEDGQAQSIFGPIKTNAAGANGRATIMLRTEQITVTALDAAHGTNGPTGRVLSQQFHGARCRLVVEAMWRPDEAGDSKNLTVETSSLSAPKVGAVVRLDIVGPAHVLTRDSD